MKEIGIQLIDGNVSGTLELKTDVQRDRGLITQGIVVGSVLNQNIAMILYTQAGEWKEYPTLGVGIGNQLMDTDLLGTRHQIRKQLESDGIAVKALDYYKQNELKIDASYK